MIELRKIIQAKLEILHPRVYFQSAPKTAIFPYLVHDIINVRHEGEHFEYATVDIDGWGDNKDTKELESLMKEVEKSLSQKNFTEGSKTMTFFIENKIPVPDDKFQRRKYTFQTRMFERSKIQ